MWQAEKIYYQGSSGYTRAYQGSELVWERPSELLTFTAYRRGTNFVSIGIFSIYQTAHYSVDGITWYNLEQGRELNLPNVGDKVYIRGYLRDDNPYYSWTAFNIYGYINVSGNINYFWNYNDLNAPLKQYCGCSLFSGSDYLTTNGLILPSKTLAVGCYKDMFSGCDSVNTIKCLATDISATDCTSGWLSSVSSTGTFIKDKSMTGWTLDSPDGIPQGWTIVDYNIPLQSISISGETSVTDSALYTAVYTPSNTTETGVTWSIVSGSQYATINSSTGALIVLNGASGDTVVIRATSIVNSSITADKTLSVTYSQTIDFTKKHWWTATSGSYNFNLPTRWNNGYYVEIDQYFTASGNTSSVGSILRQQSNNSPFEIFYNSGYYFDAHYPNSTTSPTVNTSDYDHRVSFGRSIFNGNINRNVKYVFKYQVTPTQGMWVYNGSTLVRSTTYSTGNKNYCTTQDYSIYPAGCHARSGWAVIGDIRVYDNNNTLIHNFQLYQNPNSNNEYQYYDRITETWYPVVFGSINVVETTNR